MLEAETCTAQLRFFEHPRDRQNSSKNPVFEKSRLNCIMNVIIKSNIGVLMWNKDINSPHLNHCYLHRHQAIVFRSCTNFFLYLCTFSCFQNRFWLICVRKEKTAKNKYKMWRIGNCYLSAPVRIPLRDHSEIPHQIPGSHRVVFGSSGRCGTILSHRSRMLLRLTTQSWCVGYAVGLEGENYQWNTNDNTLIVIEVIIHIVCSKLLSGVVHSVGSEARSKWGSGHVNLCYRLLVTWVWASIDWLKGEGWVISHDWLIDWDLSLVPETSVHLPLKLVGICPDYTVRNGWHVVLKKMGGDRTGPNIEMTRCVIIHNILIFMVQQGSLFFIAVGVRKFVSYKLISLDWVYDVKLCARWCSRPLLCWSL